VLHFLAEVGAVVAEEAARVFHLTTDETFGLFILITFIPLSGIYFHGYLKSHSHLYRSKFEDKEKLVGVWIQQITKNGITYYTVIDFYFDRKSLSYKLNGSAYDERNNHHAAFASYVLLTNEQEGITDLKYLFKGTYTATARPVDGYAYWHINHGLLDGTGHIVDFELDRTENVMRSELRLSFNLKKLLRADLNAILRRRYMATEDDHKTIASYMRKKAGADIQHQLTHSRASG